ncbi:hypothetical protein [Synechococcus sp. CCY9202]|uniref:hypothetical protein n=1 Tax=Synechococcus sp. CCY9202 TaxID=174698 RepID=UPI002B1FBDA6|nr:hypothetical protein [Synechococcus sp. CCY9202]MEA5422638.1 hypothetical protein [Synechococcus sp. CCY9202]
MPCGAPLAAPGHPAEREQGRCIEAEAPTFQDDQVQPSLGLPLFEMGLQRGNAPLILRGIVRENRAWCRVLEFAEEFGVSVSFEPFMLWERRGG